MEVPEIFEFADRWWLTFNTHSGWGKRLDTPSRNVVGGTFYLTAETPDGPWQTPDDNLLIGAGEGRHDAVVARSVVHGGERLVYHHFNGSLGPDSARSLGLPKVLDYSDGRLVLRPWQGLCGIRLSSFALDTWENVQAALWAPGEWDLSADITGRCLSGASARIAKIPKGDVDVEFAVTIEDGERIEIYCHGIGASFQAIFFGDDPESGGIWQRAADDLVFGILKDVEWPEEDN